MSSYISHPATALPSSDPPYSLATSTYSEPVRPLKETFSPRAKCFLSQHLQAIYQNSRKEKKLPITIHVIISLTKIPQCCQAWANRKGARATARSTAPAMIARTAMRVCVAAKVAMFDKSKMVYVRRNNGSFASVEKGRRYLVLGTTNLRAIHYCLRPYCSHQAIDANLSTSRGLFEIFTFVSSMSRKRVDQSVHQFSFSFSFKMIRIRAG